MSISRLPAVGVVFAMVLTVAVPVMAQDAPRVEVSAGYNFLHIDVEEDEEDLANLPVGWYADLAGNITSMIGVVGQITGNYKTVDAGPFEADASIHTFMGGIRAGGGASNVRPFGQVLFGAVNSKFSSDDFDLDESSTDAALQLGAGVNVMSAGGVGLRLGADYIRAFTEDEGTNAFRFAVGVVFGR